MIRGQAPTSTANDHIHTQCQSNGRHGAPNASCTAHQSKCFAIDFVQRQGEGTRKVGSIVLEQHLLLLKHTHTKVHQVRNGHVCDGVCRVGGNVTDRDPSCSSSFDGQIVETSPRFAEQANCGRKLVI